MKLKNTKGSMREQRKKTRTTLKRKADKLFGEKIRARGRCELAGLDDIRCSGQLQTMHIIGRSNHNLRWEAWNALCGCSGHHRWYTSHPFEFFGLIQTNFPDQYEFIEASKNDFWDKDYERVLREIEEI